MCLYSGFNILSQILNSFTKMQNTKLGTVSYNTGNCKRKEDLKFKIILSYTLSLRTAWAT